MALEESVSSSILGDDYEDCDEGVQYQRSSLHEDNKTPELGKTMSGLSLESIDGAEADGEDSDVEKEELGRGWSDSDKERGGLYSLPETKSLSRRRRKVMAGERREEERKRRREKRTTWGRMDMDLLELVAGRVSESGGSQISTWRISSPGDDPRDVKARLKVWAQAVALASSTRHRS